MHFLALKSTKLNFVTVCIRAQANRDLSTFGKNIEVRTLSFVYILKLYYWPLFLIPMNLIFFLEQTESLSIGVYLSGSIMSGLKLKRHYFKKIVQLLQISLNLNINIPGSFSCEIQVSTGVY